jgi:diguanylate cyclase (GGDEF)-like protein
MLQGLVMFDSSARLVVCNRRYLDMYGLSPDIVKPGCALSELLKQRVAAGTFFAIDSEQYIGELMAGAQQGTSVRKLTILSDGRIISVINRPVVGGGWVATHEDVTELRRAEERIAHAAHHDALTDLPNRTQFSEQLDQALKRVGRGERFAVLYLDLDNFKFINDTFGHSCGDELLKAVAGRLQNSVRDLDALARLGGDEFGIIQAAVEQPSDVAYLAARIQEAFKEQYDIAGHRLFVEASIGIAMSPDDGVEAEQLLKNADMAMYQAKANGPGTFCFFEREMDARVKARSALEFELRQAIMCNQFELYYQPFVNLQNGAITGCEALLRWNHPDRGLIMPAEFIPIAEETGLINQLGEWVLRTACAEAMTWPDDIKVAVNVSPVQFNNQALVLTVIGALAASGLPARRLELEVTETAIIHDEEGTPVKLSQLRELGVKIALDDFGTGYSSLSYLHRIPFDKIKIDKSFIDNIASNDRSLAIVQAVIMVAKTRNVTVVAEGVETEQQRELLRTVKCSEMQGYLFSRPVPVQDLLQFFPARAQTAADTASAA